MDSSRKSKLARARSVLSREQPSRRDVLPRASSRAEAKVPEIPPGVVAEIETQRSVLVTVITLLHGLHVVLERRQEYIDKELNPRLEAAVRWVSLPEMTALLLERTHAVLSGLDPMNLIDAMR